MAWEIERRFLVRVPGELWDALGPRHAYRQGYVRNGSPSVRIRVGEPRGPVLTSKSGGGVRRTEVECIVSPEMAEMLFLAAEDRVVEKIRHRAGPWEVDRFEGALEGLHLMEIELRHEDDPLPDPPEGISILGEVTDDKRFVNGHLARMNPKEQRALVVQVYKEFGS